MKALILAAGAGNNMAPFSITRPKPMLHVAGRPILHRALGMLKDSGFGEVNLIIGKNAKPLTDHFGGGGRLGMTINYVSQNKAGIGNAILACRHKFAPGEHFLLLYSDVVTDENIVSGVLQVFGLTGMPSAGICLTNEESSSYGNVYLDNAMNITKIVEKPHRKDMGNYVLAGVYVLPYTFLDLLTRNGADMSKALSAMIKSEGLKGYIWEKGWMDINTPWDILTANRMIMDTWTSANVHSSVIVRDAKIKGPVQIEEGVEIRSGSVIEGPAFIGRGSYIGNNSLIRKYSSLGPGSVVGFGVEMKNSVLMGNSQIGRLSFVGDSVIGENVEIGAGTMTINGNMDGSNVKVKLNGGRAADTGIKKLGAFIGDGVQLGSGHNVAPGTVIQPGKNIPHHFTFPSRGR